MAFLDNLISYFKLDEASGNALDAHGSNTLTDNASVGSGTGKIGNGRQFTAASSQFFSHTSNSDLTSGDIDLMITAWVKLDSKTAVRPIVAKWDDVSGNNDNEYALAYNSSTDRFYFQVEDTSDATGTATANNLGSPSTGSWYFLVAWHDSVNNNINIQVNDGTIDTTSWTTGIRTVSTLFEIGSWANRDPGRYMDGIIDEVGFWKRILTSGERTSLYNGGNGLAYPFTGLSLRKLNTGIKFWGDSIYRGRGLVRSWG